MRRKLFIAFASLVALAASGLFWVRFGLGDDVMSEVSHAGYIRDLWIFGTVAVLSWIAFVVLLRHRR